MHGLGGDLSPSQATTIEYTSEIGVPLGLGPTGPPGSEVQDQNTNTTSLEEGNPAPRCRGKTHLMEWGSLHLNCYGPNEHGCVYIICHI